MLNCRCGGEFAQSSNLGPFRQAIAARTDRTRTTTQQQHHHHSCTCMHRRSTVTAHKEGIEHHRHWDVNLCLHYAAIWLADWKGRKVKEIDWLVFLCLSSSVIRCLCLFCTCLLLDCDLSRHPQGCRKKKHTAFIMTPSCAQCCNI